MIAAALLFLVLLTALYTACGEHLADAVIRAAATLAVLTLLFWVISKL